MERLEALALPLPAKVNNPPLAASFPEMRYSLGDNSLKVDHLTIAFTGDACNLSLRTGEKVQTIPFGRGEWITSKTELGGPGILLRPGALSSNRVAGAYTWDNDTTLVLTLRYIESPHHMNLTFRFDAETAEVGVRLSPPPGYDLPALKGKMVK
jgi:hypothetical protein